jgi:hypothetical protein
VPILGRGEPPERCRQQKPIQLARATIPDRGRQSRLHSARLPVLGEHTQLSHDTPVHPKNTKCQKDPSLLLAA